MYAAKRSEEAERVAHINGAGDDTRWERIDVVFALGKYVGCGGTDGAPWGHEQRQGAVSDWPAGKKRKGCWLAYSRRSPDFNPLISFCRSVHNDGVTLPTI